ncbi:sigma-70 family RNA polymerase sigma factor [Neotabrizicola shimadae]|uniref:Sigma-70 family RNA polymerase sigma factor n=1 Tax=Neotabrizicola shimadae TaxID=2807096 RepID=A0A8G0ZSY6_9RHOB|nr:sigma-70 family RNA polymerase sigma factor [Neotabrizicola shimadae]QYZ68870.1 sigma-70 family RNA polymerase sigma factor [Neotabrizicola shimadae]
MIDRETEWASLFRAANAGDALAYQRLLRAITPVLRGIVRARGRTLDADTQEDIVQDVLIAIHTKRQTWDPAAPLLPWLYAITRHKVVDAFRRRGARIHLPIEDFSDALEADPAPDPTAVRDSNVLIGQLEPRAAEIVRAVSLAGETPAEVGARLSMTEGAVRVALHRAIRRMADLARGQGQ